MAEEQLLVKIEDPRAIFVDGGVDKVLADIRAVVAPLVFDMATAKGRSECASWANRVARSKTFLDGVGKDMVSGWKKQAKVVDIDRKKIRDTLDALKADVRAPLTQWETEQQRQRDLRVQQIARIKQIGQSVDEACANLPLAVIEKKLALLTEIPGPDDWYGDLKGQAIEVYAWAKQNLNAALVLRQKEAEEEEKARKEEEARAAEAREREKRELEERIEREKAEAVAAAERRAELDKQRAIEEAKRQERQKAQAEERERQRIAAEAAARERREREEKEARARDDAHRIAVQTDIFDALLGLDVTDDLATTIITELDAGNIPHVSITY
jgi:colicin import membrane protein